MKNCLLYVTNESDINQFKQDYFYHEFNPVMNVNDEILQNIPIEILKQFPIIFLNVDNIQQMVNKYSAMGLNLKNLIFWNSTSQSIIIYAQDPKTGDKIEYTDGLMIRYDDSHDGHKYHDVVHIALNRMKQFYKVSPADYQTELGNWYEANNHRPMNWENPQRFTEKIQWLKLYDTTPIKILCSDKFAVKQYVSSKIGSEYVNEIYGVWDSPDYIDLKKLPDQFVLKCNHGSGFNIIVKDKSQFNFEHAKEKLRTWMSLDYGTLFHEFHYCKVQRKIIAEKFIDAQVRGLLPDYKFHCFNGEPKFCRYVFDRYGPEDRADFFTMNWEVAPFRGLDHRTFDKPIPKPKNYELMIDLARKLAEPFAYVRADFFDVDGKIYFGELTFYPWAGILSYDPPQTDLYLGSLLKLPQKSKIFSLTE